MAAPMVLSASGESLPVLRERTLPSDLIQDGLVVGSHVVEEQALELADLGSEDLVEVALDTGVDDADLLFAVEGLLHESTLRIASA